MNLLKRLFAKREVVEDAAAQAAKAAQRERDREAYLEWVTLKDKERASDPNYRYDDTRPPM